MDQTLEIQVAVLTTKVEQLTESLSEITDVNKALVIQMQGIQQALALQKPWTTLTQHIITAVLTGGAALFLANGHKAQ